MHVSLDLAGVRHYKICPKAMKKISVDPILREALVSSDPIMKSAR
jgi:hypothetical protein